MKIGYFRLDERVFDTDAPYHHFVYGALLIAVGRKIEAAGGIRLRVGIYHQDLLFQHRK